MEDEILIIAKIINNRLAERKFTFHNSRTFLMAFWCEIRYYYLINIHRNELIRRCLHLEYKFLFFCGTQRKISQRTSRYFDTTNQTEKEKLMNLIEKPKTNDDPYRLQQLTKQHVIVKLVEKAIRYERLRLKSAVAALDVKRKKSPPVCAQLHNKIARESVVLFHFGRLKDESGLSCDR